jgi:hypothetical protein
MVLAAICAGGMGPAMAAIDFSGGGTIGVEHDSNPLEISNANQVDDTTQRLTANAAVNGGDGPIHAKLQALYRHVKYDRFNTLDHSEYNLSGGLDWKPGQVFDVSLQASQIRVPVSLADIGGAQSTQQTSRQAQGTLRVRPTPRWQLSLTPGWSEFETPLPGARNFQLRENSTTASLDYLGAGRLIPGLAVNETKGTYSGIVNATRYEQRTVQGTLNYQVTTFSKFSLSAGHTERTTHLLAPTNDPLALALEGTKPAFTGTLVYQRELSVKTSINIGAFRDFQPYNAGVNTAVVSGFTAGAVWKPTLKLSASVDSRFAWFTISGVQVASTVGDRRDLLRTYSLGLTYLASRRMSLHGYLGRRMRNSTVRPAIFDGTTAGLEFAITLD